MDPTFEHLPRARSAESAVSGDLPRERTHRDGLERHHGSDEAQLQRMPFRGRSTDNLEVCQCCWGGINFRAAALWRGAIALYVLHLSRPACARTNGTMDAGRWNA